MDTVTVKESAMKSFFARHWLCALGIWSAAQFASAAEPFGSPSLLPIPTYQEAEYGVEQTGFNRRYQEAIPSPSDVTPRPQRVSPAAPIVNPIPEPPVETPPAYSYQQSMNQAWGNDDATYAPNGSCGASGCPDGSCNDYGICGAPNVGGMCNRWFVSGGGLYMGRANQSKHAFTYDLNNYNTTLNSERAAQDFAGGFEVRLGRIIGCNNNAIELGYWGLYPSNQSAAVYGPNYTAGMGPIFGGGLNWLDYDNGTNNYTVQQWMTTSTGMHQLDRSFGYHSVEANLLGNAYAWGVSPYSVGSCCGSKWQHGWLAGFRYFRFNETTNFITDYNDTLINGPSDLDELTYHINTKNDLYGFQLGGQSSWFINNCWSLYGGTRFGVFNNHITHQQFIQGGNGYAVINSGAYTGQNYLVNSERDVLAGIGQLDAGVRYQWNCRFNLNAGYRVVGIAGVATSTGQIADNFADPRFAGYIKPDDAVLLHGGYFGGTFMW